MKKHYLVPENLDLPILLKQNGLSPLAKPVVLDKFYYIIDNLYLRYLLQKDDWEEFIPINAVFLRNVVSHRFARRILSTLGFLRIIEKSKKGHRGGVASRGYRFLRPYREARFVARPVSDQKQGARLEKLHKRLNAKVVDGQAGLQLIKNSIESITFDYESAREFLTLNTYEKPRSLEKRRCIVDHFENRDFRFKQDGYGRFHHIFTQCPRDLRPFATWDGQDLYSIDVSCCQPAIAATLYPSDCAERSRYVEMVANNRLYDTLNAMLGCPANFDDPAEKTAFKANTFHKIYYSSNYGEGSSELGFFQSLYPILVERMKSLKTRHQRYLAHRIQRMEAAIILDDAARAYADKYCLDVVCLMSIHDCLVTTEQFVPEVQTLIKRAFERKLGFAPKVKSQLLSGNWAEAYKLSSPAQSFSEIYATARETRHAA